MKMSSDEKLRINIDEMTYVKELIDHIGDDILNLYTIKDPEDAEDALYEYLAYKDMYLNFIKTIIH